MAERNDVTIEWERSPRIIVVAAPSLVISSQDIVDTCRGAIVGESNIDNLDKPALISAGGKEDLGSGTTVGITATLQNAQIAFEQRQVAVSSGTITTGDATGLLLTDSGATFISDGVEPGNTVINFTDRSGTTIREVVSETQLLVYALADGTDDQWDSADVYRVYQNDIGSIEGGNVVAVDQAGDTISSVSATWNTSVSRTSSSSATLQELSAIQFSSFLGRVTIDSLSSNTGTVFPVGTPQAPVNNIPDAVLIANANGFNQLFFVGDFTLDTGDDVAGFTIIGENESRTTLTINTGALTSNVSILNATVTGVFDTAASFTRCLLQTIQFVEADIRDCILAGTITLDGTGLTSIYDCKDGVVTGAPPPAINFNGSGRSYRSLWEFNSCCSIIDIKMNMAMKSS